MYEFEQDLLDALNASFQSMKLNTGFVEPQEGMSQSLRVIVPEVGKVEQDVLFEFFFTYNVSQDEAYPHSLLNICATIFTEVPQRSFDELDRTCMYLNPHLIQGSLGTLRQVGILAMRQNLLLRHSYPPEVTVALTVDTFLAMSGALESVLDGLAVVARGMGGLQEVVDRGLF